MFRISLSEEQARRPKEANLLIAQAAVLFVVQAGLVVFTGKFPGVLPIALFRAANFLCAVWILAGPIIAATVSTRGMASGKTSKWLLLTFIGTAINIVVWFIAIPITLLMLGGIGMSGAGP